MKKKNDRIAACAVLAVMLLALAGCQSESPEGGSSGLSSGLSVSSDSLLADSSGILVTSSDVSSEGASSQITVHASSKEEQESSRITSSKAPAGTTSKAQTQTSSTAVNPPAQSSSEPVTVPDEIVLKPPTEEIPLTPNKTYDSFEDIVADENFQAGVQSMIDTYKEAGVEVSFTGDGRSLNCVCKINLTRSDELAQTLVGELRKQSNGFSEVARFFGMYIDNPVVVVTYLDVNGEEICSLQFAA